MAYKYQLIDARNSLALKSIAGVCTEGADFVSIINEVMERLMKRGGWWETEQLMRLCAYNGCITWPRYVGTVLGIKFQCTGEFQIRNNWWATMGPHCCAGWGGDHTMRDANNSPFYNDIPCGGQQLRVYATKNEDIGKKVIFFGLDSNQQPLQRKVNGAWRAGFEVTIGMPYGSTGSVLISKVTKVIKEPTQANILVYGYDATQNTIRDLALWEPSETHPDYRRSIVHNFQCIPTGCAESDGVRQRNLEALVKLEFIPVTQDYDFLAIDNFTALKFGIQAIRLEEANQDQAAEVKWAKAIQDLNFELRTKTPGQQATIQVRAEGRSIISAF